MNTSFTGPGGRSRASTSISTSCSVLNLSAKPRSSHTKLHSSDAVDERKAFWGERLTTVAELASRY